MGVNRQPTVSSLFLVRVWAVEVGDDGDDGDEGKEWRWEWRGKVQHVVSGEAHSFGDWPELAALLAEMLRGQVKSGQNERR